jgi:hypothetical protein
MELSMEVHEDGRLRGLTFTEVFRGFAELAHRNWEQRQLTYHIVRRASQCCQRRLKQPGYAAVLLNDRQEDSTGECETAW